MKEFYQIILYLGSCQGIILTIFLFLLKSNILANRFLGLLTLSWGLLLLFFGLQFNGFFIEYPHFLKTVSQLPLLFFPLLFLNVKYLVSRQEAFDRIDILHFLPFLINYLLHSGFYFKSGIEKLSISGSTSGYYYFITKGGDVFLALQGLTYSILVLLVLHRYGRNVRNYISNTDKLLVTSTQRGTYVLLVAWIIGSIAIALELFNIDVSVDLYLGVYLLIVIDIYWISYTAIKSPEVFKLDRSEFYKDHGGEENVKDDPEMINLNNKLLEYIEEEKPYLMPELSLQDLANMLNVTRHQLSSLINGIHRKNFYEFINYHRVEEVKEQMAKPLNKNYTIISIAFDSGFNSKTSFYRIFKQFTEMTPSQYQEINQAS